MQKAEKVLSLCATCRYAEWRKTANGRRHPEGTGRCTYEWPDGPLPKWAQVRRYGRDATPITSLREALNQQFAIRYIYWVESHPPVEPCATWASGE